MENIDKALALARLQIKVFPAHRADRAPVTTNGFYAGTTDVEEIATWFTGEYADPAKYSVAVWAGGSDLVGLDIDKGKKNGKDGFKSLSKASLLVSDTHHYPTESGGEHHVYASGRADLTLGKDVSVGGVKLSGVDIRAGGSYFVWWGDTVPESRDVFTQALPEWIIEAAKVTDEFNGEGFSGSVTEWLATVDDGRPSAKVNEFMNRIPAADFGHSEMIELAWEIVRLGSEREHGITKAVAKLRSNWLREPYNTPEYRRDFDLALRGAINKAGRIQRPVPTIIPFAQAIRAANEAGVGEAITNLERTVSETIGKSEFFGIGEVEVDLAKIRRAMFKEAVEADLSPSVALSIVAGSKALRNSVASLESVWFSDGEPAFHDVIAFDEAVVDAALDALAERYTDAKVLARLARDANAFTFLSESEAKIASLYDWWGADYLKWVQTRIKHFNRQYHVASMWAVLSTIESAWGTIPLEGFKPTDCNLYFNVLGDSTSGKSEAWGFGRQMVKSYFGVENTPIVGDAKKTTALSLHRTLILRDGKPSILYSDEVQAFLRDLQTSHWQGTLMGDLNDYYGGDVPPKNTMNDKEISGKTAKSLLTVYFTGISDLSFDSISIDNWRDGFFYRFLWAFGEPRATKKDFGVRMSKTSSDYTTQLDAWSKELHRIEQLHQFSGKMGDTVPWSEAAIERMEQFKEQLDNEVTAHPLYDSVFVASNLRFGHSIMKCATLIALSEGKREVALEHLLVAIDFAGPWHRSMVLAVSETGKTKFRRDTEAALVWIKENVTKQPGKPGWIQSTSIMRAFGDSHRNDEVNSWLVQLTAEGWLVKSGDTYQLSE